LAQVDTAARVLRRLECAGVPVLWRPYHEMNGSWFWWGGQHPDHMAALWRQLFDRLVHHHGLRNLVWVWSPSAVYDADVQPFARYFPGDDVVDVLAVDSYGGHYERRHYTSLLAVAAGRPIGFGEVGELPPIDLFQDQPRWCWFMGWPNGSTAGSGRRPRDDDPTHARRLYGHERVVTLDRMDRWRPD
jgi:mannan endo-1,4-beta-mannosidase